MPHYVRRHWAGVPGGFGRSARSFEYDAFVPDPIADAELTFSAPAVDAISQAERALRDVQRSSELAGLESLSHQLLRTEAVASSWIEGLQLSHRRLARALFDAASADNTAQAVMGNIEAMEQAVRLGAEARDLDTDDVLRIHWLLLERTPDAGTAGRLRDRQNWIGRDGSSPYHAEFIPPPEGDVPGLVADLCAFVNRGDLPVIAKAAIAHAQFETIHPFADGNGRVGRALIHVVLRRRDLTPRFVPTVSLVLAGNSKAYVRGLTAFREGEVAEWVALFSAALRTAAHRAEQLAEEIRKLQEIWSAKAGSPRAHSAAAAIIDLLPAHPLMTVATAQELTSRSKQAANEGVAALERAGVLKQITVGKRNRAWEAQGLFDLVNSSEHALATSADSAKPVRPSPAASRASRFRERKGSTKK